MTKLRDYLTRTGTRQEDFARRVGTTQATISRLAAGKALPSLELAAGIERESGGEIMAASWVEYPLPAPEEDAA